MPEKKGLYFEGKVKNMKFENRVPIRVNNIKRVRGTTNVRSSPKFFKSYYILDLYVDGKKVATQKRITASNKEDLKEKILNALEIGINKKIFW